jgi:hypothetical protein
MKRAERLKDFALKTSQVRTCRGRVEITAVTPDRLTSEWLGRKGGVFLWGRGSLEER